MNIEASDLPVRSDGISAPLPKELASFAPNEIDARLNEGLKLFGDSELSLLITDTMSQVESIEAEKKAKVAASKPELAKHITETATKRNEAGVRERKAVAEAKAAREQKLRLEEGKLAVADVVLVKKDVNSALQPGFDGGVAVISSSIDVSITTAAAKAKAAGDEVAAARKARGDAKYLPGVMQELGSIPEYLGAKSELKRVEEAVALLSKTEQELALYEAGLIVAAGKVIEQAAGDKPIEQTVIQAAHLLDEVQSGADGSARRLARTIDINVGAGLLGRSEGQFSAMVAGGQERRDIAIQRAGAQLIEEIKMTIESGGMPDEAVKRAGDKVRLIIDKPGILKQPLKDHYLTRQALETYENDHRDELVDPIRRGVFNRVHRESIESVLGCVVVVEKPSTGPRKIDFKISPANSVVEPSGSDRGAGEAPDDMEVATPLFDKFAQCEAVELSLREKLRQTDATDIDGVRAIVEALKTNDFFRRESLKLADSRINGLTFAQGVRSGALKTTLGEVGVRVGEAATIGAVAALVTYVGTTQNLENARQILEAGRQAPDKIAEIWAQMNGVTLENARQALASVASMDLSSLGEAIQSHAGEIVRSSSEQLGAQANTLAQQLRSITGQADQITALSKLIETATQQAANSVESAKMVAAVGSTAGLVGMGLSLSTLGRRVVGRPVAAMKRFANRLISRNN